MGRGGSATQSIAVEAGAEARVQLLYETIERTEHRYCVDSTISLLLQI